MGEAIVRALVHGSERKCVGDGVAIWRELWRCTAVLGRG